MTGESMRVSKKFGKQTRKFSDEFGLSKTKITEFAVYPKNFIEFFRKKKKKEPYEQW